MANVKFVMTPLEILGKVLLSLTDVLVSAMFYFSMKNMHFLHDRGTSKKFQCQLTGGTGWKSTC